MLEVGIDAISFSCSNHYLDLTLLAEARGIDPDKFNLGLGQYKISCAAPDEDIITLGAAAAERVLNYVDRNEIDHVLFATETGIDQSKAAAAYIHKLLELSPHCSVIELKQACYSGTAAIQMAAGIVARNPRSKVLVVASDISHYDLATPAESSQGAGAAAMIISADPRVLILDPARGFFSEEVYDFWRPNYSAVAMIDGAYSVDMFMKGLEMSWQHYQQQSKTSFADHAFYCYHTPVPRLVEKAQMRLAEINGVTLEKAEMKKMVAPTLEYIKNIGNCYTASMYISLLSLLNHQDKLAANSRLGFYSYGSGCAAEFFSGRLQANYQTMLEADYYADMLASRKAISFEQYEEWHEFKLPEDGSQLVLPKASNCKYRLAEIDAHKRIYVS